MERKKRKPFSLEDKVYHAIAVPVFLLFVLLCAYPFYYLMICSVSDGKMVDLGKVIFLPHGFTMDNYLRVLKYKNIFRAFTISVTRVIIGTGMSLAITAYAAYFFTKQNMWCRKLWYRLTVATMYFAAGMIPVYLNYMNLGLLDNFWVYIIPGAFNISNMVLIKTNIEAVPAELEESAMLDGAGYLTRFTRIVLPLIKPILATTGLFSAVAHWNDYFCSLMYMTNDKLFTMQYLLYELLNQIKAILDQPDMAGQSSLSMTGIKMTLTVVTVIPVMCIYPFIQKYYVKGVMIGAVKG